MSKVIFFSRGGNTWKLANAIADELGTEPQHVRKVKSLPEDPDIFLGSGLYFLRPAKMVRDFIRSNDFHGKNVALFGTSTSGIGVEVLWMERLLKNRGANVVGKYFCPGKFALRFWGKSIAIRTRRPSPEDLDRAKQFARSVQERRNVKSEVGSTQPATVVP